MKAYSLYELNLHIRQVLALNFSEAVWIEAEIAQCNRSRGHYWIELVQNAEDKEDDIIAQASAVIWAKQYHKIKKSVGRTLESILVDGAAIKAKVSVDYNERYGMKLMIEDIDPSYALGKMALQRQAIIEQLKAAQLMDRNKVQKLPLVLQKIAVISSSTAAGYQDFLDQLNSNPFGYQFKCDLFPAAMQGAKVEPEVLEQLLNIARLAQHYDTVVIIRGGGAKLDLSAFDNYTLGKTIAEHPLPVLTGIGHEIDETVIDLVAHRSLKTPTAVADFILHRNEIFESQILQLAQILQQNSSYLISLQQVELERAEQLVNAAMKTKLQLEQTRLNFQEEQIKLFATLPLKREEQILSRLELTVDLLKQESILARGYALLKDQQGNIIKSIKDIQESELIEAKMSDGQLKAEVKSKTTNTE
ncbi:MAG: exodeoxyribonuclease VII large subunit [Bacteroidota bacterium]